MVAQEDLKRIDAGITNSQDYFTQLLKEAKGNANVSQSQIDSIMKKAQADINAAGGVKKFSVYTINKIMLAACSKVVGGTPLKVPVPKPTHSSFNGGGSLATMALKPKISSVDNNIKSTILNDTRKFGFSKKELEGSVVTINSSNGKINDITFALAEGNSLQAIVATNRGGKQSNQQVISIVSYKNESNFQVSKENLLNNYKNAERDVKFGYYLYSYVGEEDSFKKGMPIDEAIDEHKMHLYINGVYNDLLPQIYSIKEATFSTEIENPRALWEEIAFTLTSGPSYEQFEKVLNY